MGNFLLDFWLQSIFRRYLLGRTLMNCRKFPWLLVLVGFITAPLLPASPHSNAAFKRLLSLAGEWEGKDEHGMVAKTSFKAMASNTAVLETLAASGMDEMVSLYSIDQDSVSLVHYCPTNNQPRMKATPDSDDFKELSFEFQGAGNLKSPKEGHQHHLVIRFEDANHITETWTWRQNDKDTLMVFHLTRK
jgi:hypothetical protein